MKRYRLRVTRSRQSGWLKNPDKKSRLIIKLRGWARIFNPTRTRAKLPDVRSMPVAERVQFKKHFRAGAWTWYILSYMLGKNGWHRKMSVRVRFLNKRSTTKNQRCQFASVRHQNGR